MSIIALDTDRYDFAVRVELKGDRSLVMERTA
jgi:hypothetical protein